MTKRRSDASTEKKDADRPESLAGRTANRAEADRRKQSLVEKMRSRASGEKGTS